MVIQNSRYQDKKTPYTVSTKLGGIIIVALSLMVLGYTLTAQRHLNAMWQHQISQIDTAVKLSEQNYKFFTISGVKKPILALPPFQYASYTGVWTLVNKTHALPTTYMPKNLVTVPIPRYENDPTIKVRPELVEPLKQLYAAAKNNGIYLMVRSAYRSSADQQAVVSSMADSSLAAQPGQSEHQTGLAVDINSSPIYCGNDCALDNTAASWLANNASSYGFIVRYQADKVSITGYPAESWHLRYVGVALAKALQQSNLAFEQVYPLFKDAKPRT